MPLRNTVFSADFLASDFVAVHELPRLFRKAERAGVRVLPIIVEPCELAAHPILASFQALNSPRRPLAAMTRAESRERAGERVDLYRAALRHGRRGWRHRSETACSSA